MRYLAVDIGASSGKIIAGTLESGVLHSEVVHRFPNELIRKGDYLVWDIDALFSGIVEGLSKAGRADFVSIDTWGVDFVLLDKDGQIIGDTVSYRDERTSRLSSYPDQSMLYARTGIQMQRFNTVYQLLYLKENHPDYLERAASLLFIPDYLNYLLTGIKAAEYTFASTSNLLSAGSGSWDYELIRTLGLPLHLFTDIRKPGELLGVLKPEIAKRIGYEAKVLLAPSHDTASAVVGAPLGKESLFLSSGTWSLLGAVIDHPITSAEACRANFTNEGAADGSSIRFLRNIMGTWMLQCLKKESGCSFDELEKLAMRTVPPGLVDPGESRFLAPVSMRKAVDEALAEKGCRACCNAGEYAAVIYHSLAAAYRDAAAFISHITGRSFRHIAIVGGGSRDEYLCQLTADYTDLAVTAGPAEGTAIGNILFQMISSGEIAVEDKNDILRRSVPLVTYQRRRT